MRVLSYYAVHTFINQIRKLFKTWVMVLVAICVVVGILVGIIASTVEGIAERTQTDTEVTEQLEETVETEEEQETTFRELVESVMPIEDMIEIGVVCLILLILFISLLQSDRAMGNIFLPADAALLFTSPMRPQSVLMFRLGISMSMYFFMLVYFLLQIPNLMSLFELTAWAAFSMLLMFILTIMFGMLLQVLVYLCTSASERAKKLIRPVCFGGLLVLVITFLGYYKLSGNTLADSAVIFFNADATRWIPLVGWLKSIFVCAACGDRIGWWISLALLALLAVTLILLIRHVEADYYEEALTRTQEKAEMIEKSKDLKNITISLNGKTRKKRKVRETEKELKYGEGASVYFYKTLNARFRFASFGIFTKTMETYLVMAIVMGLISRYAFGSTNLFPLMAILGLVVFWRSLGNPIEQDTKMDYFVLIPDTIWKKMFWSLFAGTINCALDLILPLFVGALVMGANPFGALLWLPLILSVDLFATTVGLFIAVSLPASISDQIKMTIQILFVYFGILPDVLILVLGFVFGHALMGEIVTLVANLLISALFFGLSGLFLEPGGDRMT